MAVVSNLWVTTNLYKKQCLLVITWNKKHSSKQLVLLIYTLGKDFFVTAAFKGGVRHFFSGIVEKFIVHFGLYYFSLHLKRREEQIDTVHGKKT